MSGIAGVSLRQDAPRDGLLRRLADGLAHRGPDAEGVHRHKGVALIHRCLNILDREGNGHPIAAPDGKSHIIANGEIYNYRALQNKIRNRGITLRTDIDSEVPLHLWHEHGTDFVKHLEGMYALAIYDEVSEELVLARDPVGIKPLYISETGAGVAFASEAGALVRAGWLAADANPQAWPSFFNKQYVGGQHTLFKGVDRVMPGEVIRIRHGKVIERRIYPLQLDAAVRLTEEEALAAFDTLFNRTLETHLQTSVPYGAFLSGGIDSSCVVSKMAELAPPVRTYTLGITHATMADERVNAYRLANTLKTDHHVVDFSQDDFWALIPHMCEAMDDLVADPNTLPTLKLAAYAKEQVKMIVTGEGGDEGFAGYSRYRRNGLMDMLRGHRFRGRGDTAGFQHIFKHAEIANWRESLKQDRFDDSGFTQLQSYQARDISDWLPDDLLLKVDRCLMTHGIEGRMPLLDRKLLNFAFSLPDDLKVRRRQGKYLLRKWLDTRHPEQNPWQPKQSFTLPITAWLEQKRELLLPYLHKHAGIEQVIIRKDLRQWLENPLDKRGAKLLFTILSYAVWHDLYIQENPLPAALFTPPSENDDEEK